MHTKENTDFWTPERIEELKALAAGGYSARDICIIMGAISRSAVIGKLNRLGIKKKTKSSITRMRKKERREKEEKELRRKPQLQIGLTIDQLTINTCRFPKWKNKKPDTYRFCGKETIPGKPYCEDHHRVSIKKPGQPD